MQMRSALLLIVAFACSNLFSERGEAKNSGWPCYWVHGRISVYNGSPSTRIWPVGTHRLLGVVNPGEPGEDVGQLDALPQSLQRRWIAKQGFPPPAWGDFYVCPVSPERAGWMRFVILKRARRIFVEAD